MSGAIFRVLNKSNHIRTPVAAEAVPGVCFWVELQAWFIIFVKGAFYKVVAVGAVVVVADYGEKGEMGFDGGDGHVLISLQIPLKRQRK